MGHKALLILYQRVPLFQQKPNPLKTALKKHSVKPRSVYHATPLFISRFQASRVQSALR